MRPVAVVALLLAPAAFATATAAPGEELVILDGFLAPSDSALIAHRHCLRHGGHEFVSEEPVLPLPAPVGPTNGWLRHHTLWHRNWTTLRHLETNTDDANPYGLEFVMFHRHMLVDYDAWRAEHGLGPVPSWDPATPLPPEFAYEPGPGCFARQSNEADAPLPTWATVEGGSAKAPFWGYTRLCEFPDLNRLGKAVDPSTSDPDVVSYHGQAHDRLGGDMRVPQLSPRDPAFYAWHKALDERIFQAWERACPAPGAPAETAAARLETRDVPAPALPAALVTLTIVAACSRRRSGI